MMRKLLVFLIPIFLVMCTQERQAYGADPWQCGTPLLIRDVNTGINRLGQKDIKTGGALLVDEHAPAAPVQLGQIDRFFIHIPEMEVKATCVAISEHLYVYIENSVRHLLTDAEAASIALEFDVRIHPQVRKWIGSEFRPGLDRDNRITLLMHDVGMNASGRDYGGYFAPADQLPTEHNSNRREMLFMDIYQFRERARHTFYSSLAHEFAHLINWFQNGGTTDQRWLEEGIACFAEWAVYGNVHTIYVDGYLAAPEVSLTYANTPNVYYGGAFLLLLYLYEQYGGAPLIRRIVEEDTLGQQAIENALATMQSIAARGTAPRLTVTTPQFANVFLNWGLANWLNNTTRAKHLGYQNLQNRKSTATVQRVRTYPNSADALPVETWGAHYILFQNLPPTLEIALSGNGVGNLYAAILYSPLQNAPTEIEFDAQNNGKTRLEGLQRNGQIILIVTADAPQMLQYVAVGEPSAPELPNIGEPRQPPQSRGEPQTVAFSLGNRTQPSAKKSNVSYILEPMTQLHLASNYHDVALHLTETGEPYLCAASDWGMEMFALTDAGKPARIGEIATPGKAQAVAVDADTAYVADGEGGVHLIAINSPTAPKIVKTLFGFTNVGFTNAHKVHIADGKVYVLGFEHAGEGGLLVFNQPDTQNVPSPRPRRFFKTAGIPFHISTANDAIYLSDNRQGLRILKPSPLGNFVTVGIVPLLAHDFVVTATDTAFVAGGNFRVVDIQIQDANPPGPAAREPVPRVLQPEVVASLDTPGLATGIQLHNDTVYLTDRQAGLHLVDVRNPQQPQWISSQPTFGNANDVALWNNFAYIADGKGGIQTVDVSTPHAPKWTHRYAADGTAYGLDVVSERAVYIANGTGGLKTIELTTPHDGTVTQTLPLPASATTIRIARLQSAPTGELGHGFVATETGMSIVDLASNTLVTHIPTAHPVMDIALHEGYAYLCAESLIVVELDRFVPIAERDVRGSAYRIAVAGSHAYVAALEGGLHIFDITEPAMPRRISTYATQGNATEIAPASEHAYLLDSRVGVVVLDVSEPDKPKQVGHYANDALPIDAVVHGDYLYLLDSESLQIIDTHTLTAISRFDGLRYPSEFKLEVTGSDEPILYVADLYQLRIFQVHPHRFRLAVEDASQFSVGLEQALPSSTGVFNLGQNYPNPFNPETWIPYQLAAAAHVTLSIYDAMGRRVHVKVVGHQRPGAHTAYWDGRNAVGEPVASGVYFYTLEAGHFRATRKMFIQR